MIIIKIKLESNTFTSTMKTITKLIGTACMLYPGGVEANRISDVGLTAFCRKFERHPETGEKTSIAKFFLNQRDELSDITLDSIVKEYTGPNDPLTFGLSSADPESADFTGFDLTLGRF